MFTRQSSTRHRIGHFLLLLVAACGLHLSAAAQVPESVKETLPSQLMQASIRVDEVDEAGQSGKERAAYQAQMKGLWEILKRVDDAKAEEMYGILSSADIKDMVVSMTPKDESYTKGRYSATIDIVFDEIKVRALKRKFEGGSEQAPTATTGAGTLLIIPIMQNEQGELLLWQEGNPWREALNHYTLELGKGKLVMPFGDPKDALSLGQEAVLAGDVKALQNIALRYGARNVVIALAKVRAANAKHTMFALDVFLRRANETDAQVNQHYDSAPGEDSRTLLRKAAKEITSKLSNTINQFALFEEEANNRVRGLVMRVEYTSPERWVTLKKLLEELSGVQYVEVGAVSPEFAQVTIYYKGSTDAISKMLETRGLQTDTSHDYWVVTIPPTALR